MIPLRPTKKFFKDLKRITKTYQDQVWDKLDQFQKNPAHPSLRLHEMKGHKGVSEISITDTYRVTFEWDETKEGEAVVKVAVLRRVGTHDILRSP